MKQIIETAILFVAVFVFFSCKKETASTPEIIHPSNNKPPVAKAGPDILVSPLALKLFMVQPWNVMKMDLKMFLP
jgi:hypothetical protein